MRIPVGSMTTTTQGVGDGVSSSLWAGRTPKSKVADFPSDLGHKKRESGRVLGNWFLRRQLTHDLLVGDLPGDGRADR